MIKKILYSVLLMLLISGGLFAQDRILIRGRVVNKADRTDALPGVSVVEMDRDNRIINGVTTDMNGNYSITVNNTPGQKLAFSYLGFNTEEVAIGNMAVINVELEEAAAQIDELVIRAERRVNIGAFALDERDLAAAYSRIDARDVESLPVASIDQALQGRMAGVDIVANSGQPGAGMSIRVRGTSSINNASDPLIVVNGVPYDTNISDDFDFVTADEESYSQLLNISPSDIQDITVLKDAAATAQYGSRGASGVLLITTKRGAMGKPRMNYGYKGTISIPRNAIPTLNGDQYSTLILESAMNAGTPLPLGSYPEFTRDPNNPFYFYNFGQNTDWVKEVQQVSFKQDHNFSLSGGGQRATYRVSVGYLDEKGNIKKTGYTRFTTMLRLNYNISDKLRVDADLSYTHGERYQPYMTNILSHAYTKMPNQSIYEHDEFGNRTPNYFSPETTPQGSFTDRAAERRNEGVYNPIAMINNSEYYSTDDRVRPIFRIIYDALPSLRYQGYISFDIISNKNRGFLPQSATGRPLTENTVNRAIDSDSEAFVVQIENQVTWTPKISENVDFMTLGKFVTRDRNSESFSATTSNSASIHLPNISNDGRLLTPRSSKSQERDLQGTFMVNLKLWDKYSVAGILTTEGNSRFGEGHRYGIFPSVSGFWRISGEPFFNDLSYLNDFRIRGSYGVSGKAPNRNYLHFNRYETFSYTYLDELGVRPVSLELADLRWERTNELNLGFNIILFNNRLNIDFDRYIRVTNDLMFENVGIPNVSGVSAIWQNVGTLQNKGWELSVFTTPYRSNQGNTRVDFRFTLSRTQNMVNKLSPNVTTSRTPTATNGEFMARIQEGNPLGSFYGYRSDGVYLNQDETIARDANGNKIYTYDRQGNPIPVQMKFWYPTVAYEFEPGDAKYVDINHDGNINHLDIVYLGDANPLLMGGFGPTIVYNRWTLDAYFYFRYGFDVVNQTKIDMEKMYDFNNQSTATLRRWRAPYENPAEAPDNLLPRALYRKGYNWLGSDRFVEDGSFLKFKSLSVSYRLPREMISRIGLTEARLNLVAYNIFTWTKYTGMDPEVNMRNISSEGSLFSIGYDRSRSPSNFELSFGLNLTF